MTLPRTRLLARLSASEPRLVRLVAPPGFGKSSLARLFARRFERHAICDCAGVADSIDFAGRALAALASELPEGESIALARLRLHATGADFSTWNRTLLEAWKARSEHSLFIFEHAEAIAENDAVLATFGDLLAARPVERVMLVSTRVALPVRFGHYLAPHQILTLTRNELRFDDDEASGLFEGSELSAETIKRIIRLADGWPIVLLLLALFAQYDADIDKFVRRLEDSSAGDPHEQLVNEVLAAFTPDMLSTTLATAAIPNASLEDISAATGIRHATPIIDRLLRLPGFVSSETGAYQTHPLLLAALRTRFAPDLTGTLFRAARQYELSGDFLRAAELYSSYGDEAAAALALDRLPGETLQHPPSRLIDVLSKIRISTLCEHCNLWIALLAYRRQNVEASRLYDEGSRLLQTLAKDSPPSLARRLKIRLAILALELEKLSEARALLEAAKPATAADSAEEGRLALMTAAIVAAKRGRFAESDRLADETDAAPGARHLRFDVEREQIAIEKARFLGEWPELLKMTEETLYAAQRSGMTSRIVATARSVAWAAWYCNDDARVTAVRQMLEDCGDGEVRALARSVDALLAHETVDASPQVLNVARWHAALATTDPELAGNLFDAAIEDIDAAESDFLRVVVRVCAALLLPAQRRRLLEARVIAQVVESPPLQASLELLIDSAEPSDYGIFKNLAARVARSPLKIRRDVLYVDVTRGTVRRGGEAVHVSDRGLELLVALAFASAGTRKEDLASAIWPSLDGDAALNALKMCVSRTRAQAGDREAIRSTKSGYELGEGVAIDVRDIEKLLRGVRGAEGLSDSARREIREAARSLKERERSFAASWAWFAPHAIHLDELQTELNLVLAKDALRRDEPLAYQAPEPSMSPQHIG
jgi:DNA-binding winged helix-turn-helix (wHTH) protein